MFNIELSDEVSPRYIGIDDTTDDDSSTSAGYQNKKAAL
jgi:hypothetical protein